MARIILFEPYHSRTHESPLFSMNIKFPLFSLRIYRSRGLLQFYNL